MAITLVATGLGLFLRLYQLARPNYLLGFSGYDDGVDFGSAVRLVSGELPYRDFALVQPPGISLLLAPVAVLAKATGTDVAFAVARILTACAGAASVLLVGLLVRHRGVLTTTLACGIVAVHPDAVFATHTVLLEPWLVLFCLAGARAVFEGDQLTMSTRRLALGGLAFGFAGAIKVWAILPVLVVLALCWRGRGRRSASVYLAGVAAGFAVPVAPFAVIAARSFVNSVILAQLSRTDVAPVPMLTRLISLTGTRDLALGPVAAFLASIAIGAFVALSAVAARLVPRRRPPALEVFALATAGLTLLAFFWPPDYYVHYAAFFAPFLALSVALPATRLLSGHRLRGAVGTDQEGSAGSALGLALFAALLLAIGAMALIRFGQERRMEAINPAAAAARRIPDGSCVLTDNASLTLISGRFTSSDPGCSQMVDAIGTDYALDRGRNALAGAGGNPAVRATWLSALRHADFVWLNCAPAGAPGCNISTNRRIPWTAPILAYFTVHFRRVLPLSIALYGRRPRQPR